MLHNVFIIICYSVRLLVMWCSFLLFVVDTDKENIQSAMKTDSVTLNTHTKIRSDDQILWMFVSDDTLIAEIYKPNNIFTTYDGTDGKFKDRLNLNHQTGDLTLTNMRNEVSGVYELQIISRRRSIHRRFIVNVTCK